MEVGYSSEFFFIFEVYDYLGCFIDCTCGKYLVKRNLECLCSDYELVEGKSDVYLISGYFLVLVGYLC